MIGLKEVYKTIKFAAITGHIKLGMSKSVRLNSTTAAFANVIFCSPPVFY